jgi:hypothetical protein
VLLISFLAVLTGVQESKANAHPVWKEVPIGGERDGRRMNMADVLHVLV